MGKPPAGGLPFLPPEPCHQVMAKYCCINWRKQKTHFWRKADCEYKNRIWEHKCLVEMDKIFCGHTTQRQLLCLCHREIGGPSGSLSSGMVIRPTGSWMCDGPLPGKNRWNNESSQILLMLFPEVECSVHKPLRTVQQLNENINFSLCVKWQEAKVTFLGNLTRCSESWSYITPTINPSSKCIGQMSGGIVGVH